MRRITPPIKVEHDVYMLDTNGEILLDLLRQKDAPLPRSDGQHHTIITVEAYDEYDASIATSLYVQNPIISRIVRVA